MQYLLLILYLLYSVGLIKSDILRGFKSMDLKNRVIFADTVFAQEVDGEMVLLDMNSENYFGLDEVGTAIWHSIEKNGDLKLVLQDMLKSYDAKEETLKKDLISFVEKLKERGLIEVHKN